MTKTEELIVKCQTSAKDATEAETARHQREVRRLLQELRTAAQYGWTPETDYVACEEALVLHKLTQWHVAKLGDDKSLSAFCDYLLRRLSYKEVWKLRLEVLDRVQSEHERNLERRDEANSDRQETLAESPV